MVRKFRAPATGYFHSWLVVLWSDEHTLQYFQVSASIGGKYLALYQSIE
jgi:hypothetical protein